VEQSGITNVADRQSIPATTASANPPPLRLYLDQKDFGRIADALVRKDESSADLRAYNRLKACVATGRVRVYFSFVHVIETLRFGDVRSPIAMSHCEVVDTLTEGRCIRCVGHLLQAELDLALSDIFAYKATHYRDDYAYGRHADALTTDGLVPNVDFVNEMVDSTQEKLKRLSERVRTNIGLPSRQTLRAFLRKLPPQALQQMEGMLPTGMNARELLTVILKGSDEDMRTVARALCSSAEFIGRALTAMPDAELANFNQSMPAGDFSWTRDQFMTALFGTPTAREMVWSQFFAGVMSFSQLITYYSRVRPELAPMGHLLDENEGNLVHQLRRMQQFEPWRAAILGTPATWDRDIARGFGPRYLESVRPRIEALAVQYGFPADRAERELSAGGFRRLPYIRATTVWMQSYLARHRGTQHTRTPEPNDFRDLYHCVNAPYVDILVTERFAADVSKPLTGAFGTRVLRSLADLVPLLPPQAEG
jgi:hypothetical protein